MGEQPEVPNNQSLAHVTFPALNCDVARTDKVAATEITIARNESGTTYSLLWLYGELKDDILAGKAAIDRRERVELVLQRRGILGIKEPTHKDDNQHASS